MAGRVVENCSPGNRCVTVRAARLDCCGGGAMTPMAELNGTGVTRREFVLQAGGAAGLAMLSPCLSPSTSVVEPLPELVSLNAVELSGKIKTKQVSCLE